MKKMIRFTLLLFMITGVFVFASGEKVAAATIDYELYMNFNMYYEDPDTTEEESFSLLNIPENIYNSFSIFGYSLFDSGDKVYIREQGSMVNTLQLDNSSWIYDENQMTAGVYEINFDQTVFSSVVFVINENEYVYDDSSLSIYISIFQSQIQNTLFGINYSNHTQILDLTVNNSYETIQIYFTKILAPEYTITFNSNGGSTVDPIVVTEGAMLYETIWDPSTATTRSGYTFDDWYKNAGLTIPVTESDTVTADITLYAGWILNVVNYTVTFNTNGGSYIAPQSVASGNQATRPTDPSKTGYIFSGWYSEMFFINSYNFNSAVQDNITLYAQWTLADEDIEEEKDAWDQVAENLPWIILGLIFIAIIFKK
jgi:uncharacterized repeat protein (TIGR02543 family)